MKLKSVVCGTAVAALLLAGCDRRKDEPPPVPDPQSVPATDDAKATASESHLPPGIDWFAGGVDAAFAAARAANKPVFLYWGAEWCPPCAQIKTTIFSKREFQERSRLFVPVYLDGDTPSAQKYGERFGVVGYPTMILFKPDGTEITRLPGGVDVARYQTPERISLSRWVSPWRAPGQNWSLCNRAAVSAARAANPASMALPPACTPSSWRTSSSLPMPLSRYPDAPTRMAWNRYCSSS